MTEHSMGRRPGDPFAITPDPAVYVPRGATELARKQLLRSARNPAKTTALIGPPGLGKTLLLQLLAEEVSQEMQSIYLPYAALPPAELCAWALALPACDDPIQALRAHARGLEAQGSSLLLAIDDAGAMPIATARWLGELVEQSGGCLRLVLAATDDPSGNRVLAAIGSNFDIVHLEEPMTESETRKYIDGRLALAGAPDSLRARFDARIVRLLHRVSAGIPRRLHPAAAEILREAPAPPPADEALESTAPDSGVPGPRETGIPSAPSVDPEPTLGVPREERRIAQRRTQPEGIAVRVGSDGKPTPRGRRADDRGEASPESGSAASSEALEGEARDSAEALAAGSVEVDGREENHAGAPEWVAQTAGESAESAAEEGFARLRDERASGRDARSSDWEPPTARARLRGAPQPSRRAIALGALLVAFAAVAIPVISNILSEPLPIAGVEPAAEDPAKPMRAAEPREAARADSRMGTGVEPGEPAVEDPAASMPAAEAPLGPLAVQINATPWANIEVDGIDLGATPLAKVPLFAGKHAFRVRMPDGRVIERTIEIDAERRFISFE